jgi:hypothetical protein
VGGYKFLMGKFFGSGSNNNINPVIEEIKDLNIDEEHYLGEKSID